MRYIWFLLLLCSSLCADPPRVVVFDYGGVVAQVDRKPVIEFLSESLGKPYRKVKKDFAREKLYFAFNEPNSYWEKYADHALSQSWFNSLKIYKKAMLREVPGMREMILEIKMQGIQVALLSNTTKYRARFISSMGGYDLFDPILLSCYLGVKKPDPKIYRRLLQSLIWDAKDTVFIDNKEENVDASRKFGIDGVHFESVEKLKNDLEKREINFG